MKIVDIWATPPGSSGIAKFDLEIMPGVRILGLHLRENSDGRVRAFAPNSGGGKAAHFDPQIASEITAAAIAAWQNKTGIALD